MDHFPSSWGRPQQESFDKYNPFQLHAHPQSHAISGAITRTQDPIVTGTSVVALKYQDGIMMAADNLASYGSLARFGDVERLFPVGQFTIIGSSGDISDSQHTKRSLDSLMTREYYINDGHVLGTPHIYEYLSQLMYSRRSKLDPLWNSHVVGGIHDGQKFLGYTDMLGTTYQATTISTGFGAHLAQPILRKAVDGREDLVTEAEAEEIIVDCMRILYYRDARSLNKFQRAKVTAQGVEISSPMSASTEWGFAEKIRGHGIQTD